MVPGGSVLLSIRAPIGYAARTARESAFNQGCRALVPDEKLDTRYAVYALMAAGPELESQGRGTTFIELSGAQMAAFELPVPPLDEQRAIADYLDHETAKIDALIARQEQLLVVLEQRRRAFTTGLLAARVGRGDRLKWRVREVDRRAGDQSGDLPLLSVSISWGVRRRDTMSDREARADDLSNYKLVRAGEIVVNRMRAFQGALGVASEDGTVSPDYAVLSPGAEVDSRWLAAIMTTGAFVGEMTSRIRGIGSVDLGSVRTPRVNVSDVLDIRVQAPTRAEQEQQLETINAAGTAIERVTDKSRAFVTLAKERRAALITAAVTGQFDVRTAA